MQVYGEEPLAVRGLPGCCEGLAAVVPRAVRRVNPARVESAVRRQEVVHGMELHALRTTG